MESGRTTNGIHPSTVMHGKVGTTKPLAPAQGAEVKTMGSTAEEQKASGAKSIAQRLYGTARGLRGKLMHDANG